MGARLLLLLLPRLELRPFGALRTRLLDALLLRGLRTLGPLPAAPACLSLSLSLSLLRLLLGLASATFGLGRGSDGHRCDRGNQ